MYTKNIRAHLPKIIEEFNISGLLDAPCGDFNWMQHALKQVDGVTYTEGDVVNHFVKKTNKERATDNISFVDIDITKDILPDADLILVPDCLIHLSYSDNLLFLSNLARSNIKYIKDKRFKQSKQEHLDRSLQRN